MKMTILALSACSLLLAGCSGEAESESSADVSASASVEVMAVAPTTTVNASATAWEAYGDELTALTGIDCTSSMGLNVSAECADAIIDQAALSIKVVKKLNAQPSSPEVVNAIDIGAYVARYWDEYLDRKCDAVTLSGVDLLSCPVKARGISEMFDALSEVVQEIG